jgi:hypothetical protein
VVSSHHGLALSTVCLLKTRSVPKTTSGKIARSWCRRGFLEKTLQVLYRLDGTEADLSAATAAVGDGAVEIAAGDVRGSGASGGKDGYAKVRTEGDVAADVPPVHVTGPAHTAEEVRQLPLAEVTAQLESLLLQVAQQGPSPLTAPVDRTVAVSALGLDSMTLVQFKGVLEKRFHCDIPDDFLFTEQATLEQLTLAVHEGALTEPQRTAYDDTTTGRAKAVAHDPNAPSTVIPQSHKQPCCPWFTCCW